MSDSNPGGPPPAGEQPYGQNPYGQSPYGAPPPAPPPDPSPYAAQPPPPNLYGNQPPNPYATGPYAPPPGQAPLGGGPLGDGLDMYGRPLGNDSRPANVTTAAWITWVFAGLTLLPFAFATLAILVDKDEVIRQIDKAIIDSNQPERFTGHDAYGFILVFLLVTTIWCVIACVLAVFARRRSNGARIGLVISAGIAGVFCLLGIVSIVSAVPLLACIAVIVLLFTGGSNDWYAGRRRL